MTDFGYRSMARTAFERAKAELGLADDSRLKYAALELRMAMEALTYERAEAFRQMLPPNTAVRHWQPGKLLAELVKIDPTADAGATLYMMMENHEQGSAESNKVVEVGTEHVLGLKTIEAHYNALGSFLHLPTVAQLEKGLGHDPKKFRGRCEEVAAAVGKALASTMSNMIFARDMTIHCQRCDQDFTIKIPMSGPFSYETGCRHCEAPHHVVSEDGEDVRYRGLRKNVKCMNKSCGGTHDVWEDKKKSGTRWSCPSCDTAYGIDLVVLRMAEAEPIPDSEDFCTAR